MHVFQNVRPSTWNNSAPTRRIFMKFGSSIFRKSVESVQMSLNCDKNNWYYMKTNVQFLLYVDEFFLE